MSTSAADLATRRALRVPRVARPGAPQWLRNRGPAALLWVLFALILVFLYIPIFFVALFSFDTNQLMSWPMSGFTFQWYSKFFSDQAMITSLMNSIKVAASSIGIAMVIGVPAAIAIDRFSFKGKGAFQKLLIMPFVVPGVLGGISLLTFFLLITFIPARRSAR